MSFKNTRWFLGIAVGGAFSLAANSASAQITPDTTKPKSESDTVEIIPATGWVFNGKGEVTLVSNGSSTNNLGTTPATCAARLNSIAVAR